MPEATALPTEPKPGVFLVLSSGSFLENELSNFGKKTNPSDCKRELNEITDFQIVHLGLNDSNNSCPLSDSLHFATTNVYNYMRERERGFPVQNEPL